MEEISISMKSLGRIGYEQFCEEFLEEQKSWMRITQEVRDAWERAADAIIEEYEQRQPPDEEEI
jgi:hypothetical protein